MKILVVCSYTLSVFVFIFATVYLALHGQPDVATGTGWWGGIYTMVGGWAVWRYLN